MWLINSIYFLFHNYVRSYYKIIAFVKYFGIRLHKINLIFLIYTSFGAIIKRKIRYILLSTKRYRNEFVCLNILNQLPKITCILTILKLYIGENQLQLLVCPWKWKYFRLPRFFAIFDDCFISYFVFQYTY